MLPDLRFKIILFFILFFLFGLATSAQEGLKVSAGKYTIKEIFEILESRGYSLSYSNSFLQTTHPIQIPSSIADVREVLALICNTQQVDFVLDGKEILFKPVIVKRVTINGRVKDKLDGESLIGVNIAIIGKNEGVVTNAYGFYALSLLPGKYKIAYSFIGYKTVVLEVDLNNTIHVDVEMSPVSSQLGEIVITALKDDTEFEAVHTGVNKVDMALLGQIPYLMGEVDIFQGALLLPGVRNIGEDASGLNVRGGAVDQNLILLDEATIYNSNHFYGLISVFNPDAVKDVTIYKGSVPSTYGGRLSSTIHVRQKEGNDREFHVSGGLGLVSGRLLLEGPIVKEKSSFLFSTRTSFLNYLAAVSSDPTIRNSSSNFQDYNGKINWRPNARNHLFVSGYIGVDNSNDGILLDRKWGNRTLTTRWNHLFTDKLFSNFTLVYSDYNYRVNNPDGIGQFVEASILSNLALKSDFNWYVNPNVKMEYGMGFIFHRLNPGDRRPLDSNDLSPEIKLDTEHGAEPYAYLNVQQQLSPRFTLYYGMRLASLMNFGPDVVYQYKQGQPILLENITDTLTYKPRAVVNSSVSPEPRLSLIYKFGNENSLKTSYNKVTQYIHLISNTISPSPTDIWKLSDPHIKPAYAHHYSLGYYKIMKSSNIDLFVEAYYKKIDNIIEYKEGANLFFNENLETEILQGEARAYGLEFFARKNIDKFSGWLSYTLSRTERRINGPTEGEKINGGNYYPADFDKTHDFSISGVYQANQRWSISTNFIFNTGRPITFPDGKYVFDGIVLPSFSERNQFRLSNYHRWDLSARLEGKKEKKNGQVKKKTDFWTFSIYNVYSRRNAYSYLFRQQPDTDNTEIVKYSILGSMIPSVTYNFRF